MSAGQPNWQKLHEMGKLPKSARANVPMLAQLDSNEKRIQELKDGVCKDCYKKLFEGTEADAQSMIEAKCEVEGCAWVTKGKSDAVAKNYLRLHSKTHDAPTPKVE